MKIAGIIAEYNPFHNGHAFQIKKTRACGATHIVAVMGGNHLQRGEPAQFEKHIRTHAALCCGADLVLELPLPYAAATAERFASGAITVMHALGCVDMLSFGAESTLAELEPIAEALLSGKLSGNVRPHLSLGLSFARARQLALEAQLGIGRAAAIKSPNNILGIEYLKAAKRLNFTPEFCVITRKGAGHDSVVASGKFASASLLRSEASASGVTALRQFVPSASYNIYDDAYAQGLLPADPNRTGTAVLAVLRRMTKASFATLPDISEGLENRFYTAVRKATSTDELLTMLKSKRYPLSRLRRLVLSAYLGLTADDSKAPLPYIRVLGFNSKGLEVLSLAKNTATLPISSSLAQLRGQNAACERFSFLESQATDLYTLSLPTPLPCGYEFTCNAIMLK